MDNYSLLNTNLGNLNDSSLILQDDRLSIYNNIYIFLKLTCPSNKKTKTYFLIKTKAKLFKTKVLPSPEEGRLSDLISKNILTLVIPDTRP